MPRFVLLEHDHPALHWDLMLEDDGVLRTWRLAAWPRGQPGPIVAEVSFDHRLAYLEYEGPISGGRGRVVRRDRGSYQVVTEDAGGLRVRFEGEHLQGEYLLAGGELHPAGG